MKPFVALALFTILQLFGTTAGNAQNGAFLPLQSNDTMLPAFPQQYSSYFKEAYQTYPTLPKGVLEAIAYTNTRINHLLPSQLQASCMDMPAFYGVMGLVADGKGYFRNNLLLVAQLSGKTAVEVQQSVHDQILAYAAAFVQLQQSLGIVQTSNPAANLPVLIALSELPYNPQTAASDFALNSYLYSVLYFYNQPGFRAAYGIDGEPVNIKQTLGEQMYRLVTAPFFDMSGEIPETHAAATAKQNNPDAGLPDEAALLVNCTMPDGPVEYPSAIWTAANSANYSGAITPYTIAIHTVQGSYSSCVSWFQNPAASVSAHYVVRSFDGQVTQMVCHRRKAWHVGTQNSYAVGIEHEGFIEQGETWYTNALYQSSALLSRFIASDLSINKLQTYDGPPTNGLLTLSHTCHKIKGHQHFAENTHVDPGPQWNWYRYYKLVNDLPAPTTYTALSGTVYDSGGASGNYANEERTAFLIQPAGATSITLNFTAYSVEDGWDYLWIYDGNSPNGALIGKYSGTSPGTVTAYTGAVYMEFRSDCATTATGWAASYTASSAALSCPPPAGLTASAYALNAGLSWNAVSGATGYEVSLKRDLDNTWTTYTANTNSLQVSGLVAGSVYEWRVRTQCSGTTYSAYAGSVMTSGDIGVSTGTSGSYTTTLCSGNFYDSGGTIANYAHNENWTYTIAPTGAGGVTVVFTQFDTESGYDFLRIYDGSSTAAPLIGTYSGTTSPGTVTSSGGALTFRFTSDGSTYKTGWAANWTCEANCAPATLVSAPNNWYSDDFTAGFTDNGACGNTIQQRFYQALAYNGTEWRGNGNAGQLNDECNQTTIHPDWNPTVGTWSESAGNIQQTDEANGNTKAWAAVAQTSGKTWLYHWRMKIGGTGTNRRAGIHFFGSDANGANLGNSYFVYFRTDNDKVQIYDVNADIWTTPQADDPLTVDPNIWYDCKVTYNPASGLINVYMNNALVSTWTDTTPLTSGSYVSLRTGNCIGYYDYIKVYQSRSSTTAAITVGNATADALNYQNTNPGQPAGRITSLIRDANAWSEGAETTLNVDWTAPGTVTVNDGTGVDIDIAPGNNEIQANWSAATDANSGIAAYWYAVGTASGSTDVVSWTNNGTATSVTHTGLNLQAGITYYVGVKAQNGAGLQATAAWSDGFTICIPASTGNTITGWKNDDFTAAFTDTPCSSGTQFAFYQAQDYNGTEWRANGQAGFFFDACNALHPDWTAASGTWSATGGNLYQSDAANSNTNLYASVQQTSGSVYMYEWRAKVVGSNGNRRHGLHLFCDDPTQTNRGNNYLIWFRDGDGLDYLEFYHNVNNVLNQEKVTVIPIEGDVWYSYRVVYNPGTGQFWVYRNDLLLDTWTDPTPITSGVAVSLRNGNCQIYYDDVKVYKSRSATAPVSIGAAPADAVRYSNPNPATPSGRVATVLVNAGNTWSATDTEDFSVDFSAPASFTVNDGTGADIDVLNTNTQLSANWTASSDANSGLTAYQYAIGTTPGGANLLNWTGNGTNTGFTQTGLSLADGQTYYVSIRAQNGAGLFTTVVSDGVTIILPCNVPAGLAVGSITTTTAQASWQSVSNAVSYVVQYKPVSGSVWSSQTVLAPNTLSSLSGLTNCITYEVQVQAVCAGQPGSFSALQNFNTAGTLAPAITGSSDSCLGDTQSYTATFYTGATYTWSITGGTILSGQGTNSVTVQWTGGVTGNLSVQATIQ